MSDAFAALHDDRLIGNILHLHKDLISRTTVVLVDDTEGVWADEGLFPRERRAGEDNESKTLWDLYNDIAWHKADTVSLNDRILPCDEVKPYCSTRLVLGEGESRIDAFDLYLHVLTVLQDTPYHYGFILHLLSHHSLFFAIPSLRGDQG